MIRLKSYSILAYLFCIPTFASAGIISFQASPEGNAYIAWKDSTGILGVEELPVFKNVPTVFALPPEDEEKPDLQVAICYVIHFNVDILIRTGKPFETLEPMAFPVFGLPNGDPLLALIDIDDLIGDGGAKSIFELGESIEAINGDLANTSSVKLFDISSLSHYPRERVQQFLNGETGDPFTGEAQVLAYGRITSPEPASFVLFSIGILGVSVTCRRRRVKSHGLLDNENGMRSASS